MPGRLVSLFILLAVLGAYAASSGASTQALQASCPERRLGPGYLRSVTWALGARRDVWGEALLRSASGPTYEGARRYLKPLFLARTDGRKPLTDSGAYYLPVGRPTGPQGSGSGPLHVADGSEIVSQRSIGRGLTIGVGRNGRERYGSCRTRLTTPRLADGYLPILETTYADASGVRYRQESFAAPIPETGSLVSFARITADARSTGSEAEIRLTPSEPSLADAGGRLVRGEDTYLLFSPGGTFDGVSVRFSVPAGGTRTVYAGWLNRPSPSSSLTLDDRRYAAARRSVGAYWRARLAGGAAIIVPEQRVLDAMRALLVQDLVLTWRYSVGNHYQQLSLADGMGVAEVLGTYGFGDVDEEIVRTTFRKLQAPYRNWRMGSKLVGSALYYRLYQDRAFIEDVTPELRGYVASFRRQLTTSRTRLLERERYSSDITDSVYGFHSQAVAWQGLTLMGLAWAATGHGALAAQCRSLASRLEAGLRAAVRASQVKLPDGSLFVPVRLLDDEKPYDSLSASRGGSYWNLVMPYALASGLLAPGSPEARGTLRYLLLHGSRLLGLVRAGAYALYGDEKRRTSGTDQVYGLNAARFLADNDRPDLLVLSLYGHLAAGMTPGTFISGEAASVAPLPGEYFRAMFLPPNGTSNAAFLETLRLLLVHETSDREGRPRGLELAYATPRAWLASGKRIAVRGLPTSFGRLSYAIERAARSVRITIDVPRRAPVRELRLRLRLPAGERITRVSRGRLLADGETIALPTGAGHLELVATVRRG